MNDEIKEIDRTIINVKRNLQFSPERRFVELFNKNEIKTLLDYITNLQQKYDEANNAINWWSNKAKELQQENERLKQTQYVWSYDLDMQLEDYKSRCEKASDKLSFIDEALENDTLNVPLCIAKINSALNILQNESDSQ